MREKEITAILDELHNDFDLKLLFKYHPYIFPANARAKKLYRFSLLLNVSNQIEKNTHIVANVNLRKTETRTMYLYTQI